MKTVILGGSFNPVHWGHLFLAEEVTVQEGYERVLFVPATRPAHKTIEGSTPVQRLDMLRLAVQDHPIDLETCEMERGGVSYSIEMVKYVYQKYTLTGKPALIIGDDLFETFSTWRDAEELASLADLLIAHRLYEHELSSPYPHKYLANKILPLSSSEIRQRVEAGRAWKSLVPTAVSRYIVLNGLYRTGISS